MVSFIIIHNDFFIIQSLYSKYLYWNWRQFYLPWLPVLRSAWCPDVGVSKLLSTLLLSIPAFLSKSFCFLWLSSPFHFFQNHNLSKKAVELQGVTWFNYCIPIYLLESKEESERGKLTFSVFSQVGDIYRGRSMKSIVLLTGYGLFKDYFAT